MTSEEYVTETIKIPVDLYDALKEIAKGEPYARPVAFHIRVALRYYVRSRKNLGSFINKGVK